jgi:CoA:oxalate CoA-transferase
MGEPILSGIRVVDLTQYLAGPTVTRLMAEMGADVVKIEQAPNGDPTRTLAVMRDGRSGYFVQQNRGKKSFCVDFDRPEGREALDRLIARADVVVENYGPGVLERRGLGHTAVLERHPRLVYASLSGFGRTGAYANRPAFDLIAQAYSGLLHLTGPTDGAPTPVGVSYADVSAGVVTTAAIGFALFHRERTGRGGHIDISMIESLFHMQELAVQGEHLTGGKWRPRRSGAKSLLNAPQGVYRGPESWIVLHVMASQWPGMCRAMGQPELEHDERFRGLRERQKNRDELNALVEEWMASCESDVDVLARLEAERVPCAPVLDAADAQHHELFTSRGTIRTVPDPILGEVRIPASPLRFSEQPEPLDLVAPLLGEHNESVLTDLGFGADEIAAMRDAGVVRSAAT